MREILFKAKRIDNGEWINGDLITTPFIRNETQENIPYILDITKADYDCFEDLSEGNGIFEVDPSTICQYTGLTDKNGQKIWENDVVQYCDCTVENYVIAWESDKACFEYQQYGCSMMNFDELSGMEVEVIGNIFDNPELLSE